MLAAAAVLSLKTTTTTTTTTEEETTRRRGEDDDFDDAVVKNRRLREKAMLAKRTNPLIRFGAWDVVDAGDAKAKRTTTRRKRKDGTTKETKEEKKKNNDVDALTRFVDDFREVHTLAPEVLPECERRTAVLERLETTRAKAEKTPSVVVQRFKIDMTAKTGVVDNDDDAIEEDVEKAVKMAVGLSTREDENEDEDEASCEVRVLETSEGAVASSSSSKDMDGIIVVVDFRESRESISSVSFENDDEDDDENKTYSSRDAAANTNATATKKEEEVFEGGIVKPDLETSLKSLHPFAISIRRLSKRLGEDNVFVVVTHCGDDYVDKRDWCELIDVPPENVTFCQSSFVHALSEEEYNENKSNTFPSSAMYVDISDRLVEWIDDWRDARGKSLRRAFQDERETVHFFAALKDAYFIPFEKKKKKKNEEKEEEEEEEERNDRTGTTHLSKEERTLKTKKILDDESAASNGTDEAKMDYSADDDAISKKVVDSHSRIALKTVSACFDRAIEGMGAGVINGAPAMAAKFDKNYASSSDKMITRNQLHYFVSKHAVAQYPAAFILAWAIPGPFMAHPVHLSNRFRIALCFAIVGGRDYLNMETIATTLALGAGADGLAVLNASFEEDDLERQENDDDDDDEEEEEENEESDESCDEEVPAAVKVKEEKEDESVEKNEKNKVPLPIPKTKHEEKEEDERRTTITTSTSSKLFASVTERVNAALSALETSTAELRQNAENAIKDAFTIADRTVAKAERKAKKLTRKSLNRALDDGLITRKQALRMSKVFFRNAFCEYVVRDVSALICGPRYLLFTQADLTQIINSSMTFYVAEAACKTFLPDRFNNKEKLEIDGANASTMKSLGESDAAMKAKEYCDAASEKLSQTAESAKQSAEAAKVKAQEAAAKAAQSAHHAAAKAAESAQEAAKVAQENAQKATEAVWSYVSSISSSFVTKTDDDSDLIDKSLDPKSYAAKLVPQIPSYKLAAAFSGPAMKKALMFNLPALLADANCRDLGFTKSVWTGNSKELDDLFAKYDQEKRIRAVARKALVLCLQSSNKKSVAEELKKCGLMQSEKSKMHLKLEERQKERKKESNSATTSPTSSPPPSSSTSPSVFANVQLPSIPSPSSLFTSWGRGAAETTSAMELSSKDAPPSPPVLQPIAVKRAVRYKKGVDDETKTREDDDEGASPTSPIVAAAA